MNIQSISRSDLLRRQTTNNMNTIPVLITLLSLELATRLVGSIILAYLQRLRGPSIPHMLWDT